MADTRLPRLRPCASCPYRRDCPSGVWSAEEYDKLPAWDGETPYQDPNAFGCHQGDGALCSGWIAHRGDPRELLAVRLGIAHQTIDPSVIDYTTDVPLFTSGAEAAEHGRRDIDAPSEKAVEMIHKICRVRNIPLAFVLLLALLGCGGPAPQVWACATTDTPPTVVEDSRCPTDRAAAGAGVKWYSAPESDIAEDDVPVIGQELDGDFWDLRDRLDLDETKKKTTTTTKATKTTTTTTKKPRPATS